jgi:hypothetical protein
VRRAWARWGLIVVAAAALLAALAAAPAAGSEYSKRLAQRVEREVVYVDPKARPKVSIGEAGDIRLRILKKAPGRIKIAVVPEGRAVEEGGVSGLASAMARDVEFRGTLMVVAGRRSFTLTSHPASDATAKAVQEAFDRREDDSRGKQLVSAVDAIAAVDPGPSADPAGAPPSGIGDFGEETDDVFDTVNDAFRITTIIIALSFILPILAIAAWIVWRVRKSRKEAEGDLDFVQEGLRNQLIALGDDIRALEVDVGMPGVNALAVADYEAAVQQYDKANFALERSEQNPRYVEEARGALREGERRISDAKVRLGVTPIP